jgi:hypothetical protein
MFQNLAINIVKVQNLRGIILLGGDFNARTATPLDTIDISNLCELLQALELADSEQLGAMVKRQNHDDIVGG